MPPRRNAPPLLLILAVATLNACDGDSPTGSDPPAVTIELTAPVGGETFTQSLTIGWRSHNATTETVTIRLSNNSGASWSQVIASALPHSGSYTWDVSGAAEGSTYRIQVELVGAAGTAVASAECGSDFTIDLPAFVLLLSPVGREHWKGVQTISWQSQHAATETATIRLSDNSGVSFDEVVASGLAHTGTYDWDISQRADGSTYRIRVELLDASQNLVSSDESEYDFTIEKRLLLTDINFADANLRTEVLRTGKTWADQVMELRADQADIVDLDGIEHLTDLTHLELDRNSIVDVAPLAGLAGITYLTLSDNAIADITPLAGLTQLQTLDLDDNAVANLEPLAGLTMLTELDVSRNQVTSLAPLASLTGLVRLSIGWNTIPDLGPLAGMTALTYLHASYVSPTSLAPLATLASLDTLYLQGNGLTGLDGIASLTGLTNLWVPNNHLTSIAPLAGMTGLQVFAAYSNSITSLAPLAGMTQLVELRLIGNPITDFDALQNLINVRILGISSTGFSDFSLIAGMTQLAYLNIYDLGLTDLTPLAQFPELREIWASSNAFTDLSPLGALQHLEQLDFRFSNITDVSPLAAITTLRYVYAKDNAITTGVAALVTLTNAQQIELVGNNQIPCADLDALEAALGSGVVERPAACS